MNPETPQSPITPASTPQQPSVAPAAPAPVAPPNPTPASVPVGVPNSVPQGNRSSVGKIIAIVAGVVVLLAVLIFAYFAVLGRQVINTSNNFMKYETSGDTAKALSYTNAATDSEKQYIEQAATKTHGTSKLVARQVVSGKVYFLYSLTGATYKSARTTVEKVGGKWKVTNFIISTATLQVTPGAAEASTPATTQADGMACLVPADFDTFFKEISGTSRPASYDYTKVDYVNNVHFNADALTFSAPEKTNTDIIAAFANFAKQNAGKMFTVHLRGSVGTTKQSDLDFATQRANKVRDLLVAQGVPSSSIVVDAPGSVADYGSDNSNATNQQTARNVVMTIKAACTSPASSIGR